MQTNLRLLYATSLKHSHISSLRPLASRQPRTARLITRAPVDHPRSIHPAQQARSARPARSPPTTSAHRLIAPPARPASSLTTAARILPRSALPASRASAHAPNARALVRSRCRPAAFPAVCRIDRRSAATRRHLPMHTGAVSDSPIRSSTPHIASRPAPPSATPP